MLNKGPNDHGFMICEDCGAAMPGDNNNVLAGKHKIKNHLRQHRTISPYGFMQEKSDQQVS